MLVNPISNQTNFQAVNQKYYQWAKKDIESGRGMSGEVLRQLRYRVLWHDIHPQDGIDTINAIIKLRGRSNEFIEHVLDTFRTMLEK